MGRQSYARSEDVLYPCRMLLADFMTDQIERAKVDLAKQRTKVRRSLQAFLGEGYAAVDATRLCDASFLKAYSEFLQTAYNPTDNNGRVISMPGDKGCQAEIRRKRRDAYLARLRSIVNVGIGEGILPDVDPFSALPDFSSKRIGTTVVRKNGRDGILHKDDNEPFWTVILVTWPDTAEQLESRIARCEDVELSALAASDIYCPCHSRCVKTVSPTGHTVVRRVIDKRRSVLRNTLFVRAKQATLKKLQVVFPEAWVMRRRGASRFVSVPAKQLQLMRNVLDVFGTTDDVDIIFDAEEYGGAKTFESSQPVVLRHPDFAGQVAAVINKDKRRSTEAVQYYHVQFISAEGVRFTVSMPDALLEPLRQEKDAE